MPGAKEVVGRKGKRRDTDDTPAVNLWKTDIIDNRKPDYAYQFWREDQVRDKLRGDRIVLKDFETGENEVHDIPAWEICRRDTTGEELAGYRPDEGKPLDSVLRHGPMVCMMIPQWAKDLLDRKDEQVADGYEQRLNGGATTEYNVNGDATKASAGRLRAGNIRITENPLSRT